MEETKTLTVINSDEHPLQTKYPPLISSFNSQIRPLLDAIDDLRHLNIMKEGIQLPTIVVVGDQSSGKSSVLESLAGINLPRGQGICTRVPLIMRLQHHPSLTPNLCLEYLNKSVDTDEQNVAESIESATWEIAGSGKGISHTPLTLVVKKNGVPDLTMVDLPGITRVAVQGQPENIYEQIHDIIMEYITPEESIILNVLSAAVDFSTCESIRMSQKVDKSGERTLAVVTKADKAPEGLLEKVTTDDVRIGLGYVCVRNRIGDETYVEARAEEASLFQSHPQLSRIEKSMVGVPVLAEKLTAIQATSIARCLPRIVKQINDKLNSSIAELNKLPSSLSSHAEAMATFMKILGSSKESLRKILVRGEYEEYPDDKEMHCTARLAEFLNDFSCKLMDKERVDNDDVDENFLVEEIRVLEEAKGIGLPNFVPRAAFLNIMQNKINQISVIPEDFACKVWDYVEIIVLSVLGQHSENYPQLASSTRRAAQNMILKMKGQSLSRVKEIIEMEKVADYTCSPEYMVKCNNLMENLAEFTKTVNDTRRLRMEIEGIGEVAVHHLRKLENILQPAFEMKMRVTAYWQIVLRRSW
ncbi:dynamin-related protein 4C-like isoform X2 [Chenopodium quinoa]|uniref:dynamin-related protein 4C-like isoform X2 n=1 Tax=Chenopodium quinoa TaxID=63459 RepID=UPI000B786EA8|nr:dynamin-related protein 4C-like isoform X2 [Chenopodium quinoa]